MAIPAANTADTRILGPGYKTTSHHQEDKPKEQDDCLVNINAAEARRAMSELPAPPSLLLPKKGHHLQASSKKRVLEPIVPTPQPVVSQEEHAKDRKQEALDVGKLDNQHDDDDDDNNNNNDNDDEDDSTTLAFDSRHCFPRERVQTKNVVPAMAVNQPSTAALDPLWFHPSHHGERALRTTTPWSSRRSSAVSSLSEFDPASGSVDEDDEDEEDSTSKRQSVHVIDSIATPDCNSIISTSNSTSTSNSNSSTSLSNLRHHTVLRRQPIALVVDAQPPIRPSRRATATTTTTLLST